MKLDVRKFYETIDKELLIIKLLRNKLLRNELKELGIQLYDKSLPTGKAIDPIMEFLDPNYYKK